MSGISNHNNHPFADYLWMENIEKFDLEVEAKFEVEFEEEEYIRASIEKLLEEEEERETVFYIENENKAEQCNTSTFNGLQRRYPVKSKEKKQRRLSAPPRLSFNKRSYVDSAKVYDNYGRIGFDEQRSRRNYNAERSFLNPNAKAFVPQSIAR